MRTLVVRLDNAGDVLLAGPAVRAVAAGSSSVTMLVGPRGEAAADLLPGVDEVLCWRCPWIDPAAPPVRQDDIGDVVRRIRDGRFDRALVLTSFHQSPLPTALVLRLAGVPWIGATSVDYPGALLDLRHRVDEMLPEPERGLLLARAAGFDLPTGDDGSLAVRQPLPDVGHLVPDGDYVVLHPGTSVPARAWSPRRYADVRRMLLGRGNAVVVTGSTGETMLTGMVAAGTEAVDLGGRTTLAELASVLAGAEAVVVANTGPAHLAAAVGTSVVSLFAPTVPAERWAPYGVARVLLGDQQAVCRDSRVTDCPYAGHPCLSSVRPDDVVEALEGLRHGMHPVAVAPAGTLSDNVRRIQ